MEDNIYITILYDYYGELLSKKNKEYFENYYFLNLSLGEISQKLNVSRNAVHKQLLRIKEELISYEMVLKNYEKDKKLKDIIDDISDNNIKKRLEDLINL